MLFFIICDAYALICFMSELIGAIFRLGGPYIENKKDSEKWKNFNDIERLKYLFSGHHFGLAAELILLLSLSFYLLYLRFVTVGIITETCEVI